ncbi:hypothetical protein K501DRAFT_320472 [Backusella circina FSU 941]|nr:hypothetical protein K501DRAFT_320472 [Backusella circina FSU 941]
MAHTATDIQGLNFSNYFTKEDTLINNNELNNRKKKASRACLHCQRAHLTCDDSRPCQRCVKRDLAGTCSDGTRKKAKYLEDLTPEQSLFQTQSTFNNQMDDGNTSSATATTMVQMMDTSQLFDFTLSGLEFGSATIGSEYGFIGNMLQNPLADITGALSGTTTSAVVTTTSTTSPMHHLSSPLEQMTSFQQQASPSSSSTLSSANQSNTITNNNNNKSNNNTHASSFSIDPTFTTTTAKPISSPTTPTPNKKQEAYTMKRASTSSAGRRKGVGNTPEEAYASVKKPFNYAEGFHYLIQYFKERMGRDDLMRISRALALFRPSFLALIMNLTEEDLIFMEKCIQRTLLEYEKLISFSGTPSVIWRRTGEICLVGKEFSLLTQWSKDMLLNRKVYIYELMDSQSAVEYWEKFSTHAFDNTDKSCIYSCILRTPQQRPVPCTFCFTIKRDIFDLPSVIVGNGLFFFLGRKYKNKKEK